MKLDEVRVVYKKSPIDIELEKILRPGETKADRRRHIADLRKQRLRRMQARKTVQDLEAKTKKIWQDGATDYVKQRQARAAAHKQKIDAAASRADHLRRARIRKGTKIGAALALTGAAAVAAHQGYKRRKAVREELIEAIVEHILSETVSVRSRATLKALIKKSRTNRVMTKSPMARAERGEKLRKPLRNIRRSQDYRQFKQSHGLSDEQMKRVLRVVRVGRPAR